MKLILPIKLLKYTIVISLLCYLCVSCSRKAMLQFIRPAGEYSSDKLPAAPDYSQSKNWHRYALQRSNYAVDVFFVHPTTYITGKGWNQDLDNEKVNWRTEVLPIHYQASAFFEQARMFIPKYRQAIFYSFIDEQENGKQALELAYQDVKAAFYYYWNTHNKGRPFILASHSQGSFHSKRLLAEILQDSSIQAAFVAGYLVGWPIKEQFVAAQADLEVCSTATQTGCIVSWNTEGYDIKNSLVKAVGAGEPIVCVNPLTWTLSREEAAKTQNRGALLPNKRNKEDELILHYCNATIQDGALKVELPASKKQLQTPMGKDNYHLYDYNFFYQSIKDNAATRAAAYQAQQSPLPTQ